jgi:23S rRNA A2030 N6-methylase RlmJ
MNYRHAFHAGNFADVHKHSVLTCILSYLRLKPGAFRVIDTHAGAGRYDLLGTEATRSGEWRQGIARIWQRSEWGAAHDLIRPYLDAVAALNPDGALRAYPGSPLIAKSLLRLQDRLIACELEKGAAAALANALRDRRCKALTIDGWTAAARAARARPDRSSVRGSRRFRPFGRCSCDGAPQMADGHLSALVSDQRPASSRPVGTPAWKAARPPHPALGADGGAGTSRR